LIERIIYKQGPLSKPKLAEIANLSIPTVNKIVDSLEKKGRVCPVGLTTEGVGRKAILYKINKDSGCIIAMYYTGEKYSCRLSDVAGNTLYKEIFEIDAATPVTAMDSTVNAINNISDHAPSEVKTIGVGVPGVVTPEGRLWGIPKIGAWEGFNLEEALLEYFDTDIYIENDVKLSTVGHYLTHLSDEIDNMAYIYAGNGMGSGIIINKKLYRGSTNFSGELGYMAPLDGKGAQLDYTRDGGYLETNINPLIKQGGGGASVSENSAKKTLVNYFTAVAANYISIIDPNAIIFGGEAFDEALVEDIRACLKHYSPQRSIPQILYDGSDETGLDGLVLACMGNITNTIQLVQNGGV